MFHQAKLYVALAAGLLFIAMLVGAGAIGYRIGTSHVQESWDRETIASTKGQAKAAQDALEETKKLSREAQAQSKVDLQAALEASEKRQAERTAQAVRQAALLPRTQAGAYVSPECVVDADTFKILQEQLK